MENSLNLTRSPQTRKFSESAIDHLQQKQLDLLLEAKKNALLRYRKRRFKPFLLVLLTCWLIVPVWIWTKIRRKLPEWKALQKWRSEWDERKKVLGWQRFWMLWFGKRNLLQTQNEEAIYHFYATLINATQQYNLRLDLFDYALDRQNKRLDTPLTVGELDQIETTFQRIHDELSSASKLLEVAEANPQVDFSTLLLEEHSRKPSAAFISQAVDLANMGQFVQDLLVIESELRDEITKLTRRTSSHQETDMNLFQSFNSK